MWPCSSRESACNPAERDGVTGQKSSSKLASAMVLFWGVAKASSLAVSPFLLPGARSLPHPLGG